MAMIRFTVRRLTTDDGEAVVRLGRSLDAWFNEEGLRQMARDLETHRGYVATTESGIVGFATWNVVNRDTADLSWLGVARDVHRNGIGRALVQAIVADLRAAGIRSLDVSTVADSVEYEPYVGTRRFYRALGFVDHRVDRDFFQSREGPYDRLLMRLDLAHVPPSGSKGA